MKRIKFITKLLQNLLVILCLETVIFFLPVQTQAASLLGLTDYIADDTLSEIDIIHNVGFLIPPTGHTIVATDYIRIILTNYADITAPTTISGVGGGPVFGSSGNVAYVTNVTAGPNTGIGISGITATNPAGAGDFDITVQIANDLAGTIVYDSETVDATVLKGTSAVSLIIPSVTSELELSGYTSPDAFVTILLDTAVVGTTTADSNGNFYKMLTGLSDGTFLVEIYAEDTLLRQTQTLSFNVDLFPSTTTTISNLVIPPTIEVDPTTIFERGTTTIFGLSHPDSQVVVFVESYSAVAVANSIGEWSYDFLTRIYPVTVGVHNAYARETVLGGYQSPFTQNVPFTVNACIPADVNCDTFVDLTDFSIILYYWEQIYPANFRADVNGDFAVNLTDVSIMLFYWTG